MMRFRQPRHGAMRHTSRVTSVTRPGRMMKEMMRRTLIAMAWLFGTTVPALAAVVFYFGCCVLPFHAYIHKAMPLCHIAMDLMSGQQHDAAQQPVPAREKQEPVKRIATNVPRGTQLTVATVVRRAPASFDANGYRSFISLGALRCDQDVGLHLLTGTLLI